MKSTILGAFAAHLMYDFSNFSLQDPYMFICSLFNNYRSITEILSSKLKNLILFFFIIFTIISDNPDTKIASKAKILN